MDEMTAPETQGRPVVLAVIAFILASRGLAERPGGQPEAGSIKGPAGIFVSRALGLALDKLRSSACLQIFADFQGTGAASLDEILRERGETAEEYLRRMRFHDGSRHRLCIAPGVSAVTRIGSLDVLVCGSFQAAARRDPASAANVLIHEELHSLGAGESPMPGLPTSEEITARVALRCGR
ncbi:MAG TPA: hypothetical protein VJ776_05820 [Thermoanaerobaculia bacterium]|nr:hypothetical protein [Thermoanaerobaculia bacterium]